MNTTSVIFFITKSGHLIGVAGLCLCLFLFYLQVARVLIPGLGGWSAFRIERLFGLSQRFIWLAWLTGISLMVSFGEVNVLNSTQSLWGDKLAILLALSCSTLGIDKLVKSLFLSIEGGRKLFQSLSQALWLKFWLAMSVASWSSLIYLVVCYFRQQYSQGQGILIALIVFSVLFALLVATNDRWMNFRTSRETIVQGR